MLKTHEQHSQAKLLATVVSVLVIAGIIVIADHLKSNASNVASLSPTTAVTTSPNAGGSNDSSSGSSNTTPSSSSSASTGSLTDGTYTASSDYFVPSGSQSIKVDLTLKSGVITAASIEQSESDPTSAEFQQGFASQYKSYVVGQKISDLQLSAIAGASDTTQGFANALQQIASKAKA